MGWFDPHAPFVAVRWMYLILIELSPFGFVAFQFSSALIWRRRLICVRYQNLCYIDNEHIQCAYDMSRIKESAESRVFRRGAIFASAKNREPSESPSG